MDTKYLLAIATAAYLLLSVPAAAQKNPTDEVGFNPQKLYDVHDIDSVNLFNGNLTVTLPIGRRYEVGAELSYQLMLIYNGRTYDIETYECEDSEGNVVICEDGFPTRQSNAGVGWRVSLGRLLAPHDVTANRSSFDRDDFIYEGPAGDEHSFPSESDETTVILSDDPQPLRLIKVSGEGVPTRDVEFPSGEVHRFQQLGGYSQDQAYGVWHLVSIRDRFSNTVTVAPVYGSVGGTYRETGWLITDSVGRSHQIHFVYHSQLDDTWNRGMSVSSIVLDGFGGADTTYAFSYSLSGSMPTLESVILPDATSYSFLYETPSLLTHVKLPTGGSVAYTYQSYTFANEDVCLNGPTGTNTLTKGIQSRTISDGVSTRVWEYVQRRGPKVPVGYDNPPCYNVDGSYANHYGPFYWVRTSILAPVDVAGERVRSDHYFNIFYEPPYPDIGDHPLASVYRSPFGFPGVAGRPNDARAKGSLPVIADDVLDYPSDVSGSDGTSERSLASRTYGGWSRPAAQGRIGKPHNSDTAQVDSSGHFKATATPSHREFSHLLYPARPRGAALSQHRFGPSHRSRRRGRRRCGLRPRPREPGRDPAAATPRARAH